MSSARGVGIDRLGGELAVPRSESCFSMLIAVKTRRIVINQVDGRPITDTLRRLVVGIPLWTVRAPASSSQLVYKKLTARGRIDETG